MATRAAKAVWRFAATNTHLYPGARLRPIGDKPAESAAAKTPARGDALVVEFSDLCCAMGEVCAVEAAGLTASLGAHTTAKGTTIVPKVWRLLWDPAAGFAAGLKVTGRSGRVA